MSPNYKEEKLNYRPENVVRTLRNIELYRKRIDEVRRSVMEELLRLQEMHDTITATSAVKLTAEAVSKTNHISDPTALKAMKLQSGDITDEITDLQQMLESNEETEREINRIYRCFAKTADILPLHFHVANLAWRQEPGCIMKQIDIAKEIGRRTGVVSTMLKNEAKVISLMAYSEYEQLSMLSSAEWLSFLKSQGDKLYENILKFENE